MSLLFALLAQIGPAVTSAAPPVSQLPPEVQARRDAHGRAQNDKAGAGQPPGLPPLLVQCLALAGDDPPAAESAARPWLMSAKGEPAAHAGHCLGAALGLLGKWTEAAAAFASARENVPAAQADYRARLGAMAGNAALAGGEADLALAAFDTARADAQAAGLAGLAGEIEIDRARALVALRRDDEAAAALAAARAAGPDDPEAWLLSATLSRRMDRLAEAQIQIEKAADLLPVDPAIGLEAGVIAALSGRDEAARKSWQSVIAAAPESTAAASALAYLAQLGEAKEGR